MQNLLVFLLQPADWDDREYIEDSNDVKPEVLVVSLHTTVPMVTYNLSSRLSDTFTFAFLLFACA